MTEQLKKMVGINQLVNGFTIDFKLLIKTITPCHHSKHVEDKSGLIQVVLTTVLMN